MAWHRDIMWHRLDERGEERCIFMCEGEVCVVEGVGALAFNGSGMLFHYRIECDAAWQIRLAVIGAQVGSDEHSLALERRDSGHWFIAGVDAPQFDQCADLHLTFSPSTDVITTHRLALEQGRRSESRAVLVSDPTLALDIVDQRYERVDETVYRYTSGEQSGTFSVDADGLVTEYPGRYELATVEMSGAL